MGPRARRRVWTSPVDAGTAAQPAAAVTRKGAGAIRIRDIKDILTRPDGIRLVVVKWKRPRAWALRPGLRNVHAARLRRATAIEQYLKPFLIGRDVDEIEDIWQSSYMSSLWRNNAR